MRYRLFFLAGLIVISCQSKIQSELLQAEKLIDEQRYEDAVGVYERVVTTRPDDPQAVRAALRVGEIYQYQLKNRYRAIEAYEKLAKQFPESQELVTALERVAEIYSEEGNFSTSQAEYQRLIGVLESRQQASDQYRYEAASCYLKMRDYDQAVLELENFITEFPKSRWVDRALYDLGESYFLKKDFKSAIKTYRRLILDFQESPLQTQANFNLALTLEEIGEWNQALVIYESLRDIFPNPEIVLQKIEHLKEMKNRTHRG